MSTLMFKQIYVDLVRCVNRCKRFLPCNILIFLPHKKLSRYPLYITTYNLHIHSTVNVKGRIGKDHASFPVPWLCAATEITENGVEWSCYLNITHGKVHYHFFAQRTICRTMSSQKLTSRLIFLTYFVSFTTIQVVFYFVHNHVCNMLLQQDSQENTIPLG